MFCWLWKCVFFMSGSTHLSDKCFSVLSYLALYHIYLVCFSTHTTTSSTHHFVWRCLTGPHWPWHFTWIYGSADAFDQSYFTTSYLLTHKQSMAEHARVLSIVLVTSMDCFYGVFVVKLQFPFIVTAQKGYSYSIYFLCGRKESQMCLKLHEGMISVFLLEKYNLSFLHLFFVVSVSSVFRQAVNSACDSDCA